MAIRILQITSRKILLKRKQIKRRRKRRRKILEGVQGV
jgi:hypothetical protein